MSQILNYLDEQAQKLNKAISDQQAVATQLAKQLKSNAQVLEEMNKIKKQLIKVQAALEVETKALDKALDDQMEILKLPQVKSSSKRNLIILMRYGKVYFLMNELPGEPDDKDISIVNFTGRATASPKRGSGYDCPRIRPPLSNYYGATRLVLRCTLLLSGRIPSRSFQNSKGC